MYLHIIYIYICMTLHDILGGGGSTPKNPNPKWDFKLFLGFLGFLGFFRKRCGKYLSQHS